MNPIILWLAVAGACYGLDKAVKKYNFMYGVYAALTIVAFLAVGVMKMPDPDIAPFYGFFIAGQIFFFLISVPMWKFVFRDAAPKSKLGKSKEFYEAAVGKVVEVGKDGLNSVSGGFVQYNDETFPAKIAKDTEIDNVDPGTKMVIREVFGDTFILIPKV